VRVVCLVRESATESTDERLRSSLTKYRLLDTWMEQQLAERVSVVAGDVALVQLGLKDEDYHLLSYDTDVVIHAAAYVNLIYPYQARNYRYIT
jgi:thioester reductase-like protein